MPRLHFPWRDRGKCKWLKNDNSKNNDEEKGLGCLYDTFSEETKDDVCDKKMTIVKKMTRKKNLDA